MEKIKKCRKCADTFTIWELDEEDDSYFEDCSECREKDFRHFFFKLILIAAVVLTVAITILIEFKTQIESVLDSIEGFATAIYSGFPSLVQTFIMVGFPVFVVVIVSYYALLVLNDD